MKFHWMLGLFYAVTFLPGTSLRAQSFTDMKAANWHQWRGPEGDGVSHTANPPLEWSEDKNVQWKFAIDGNGTSTPIVWGDRVYLLTAIDTGVVFAGDS